MKIPPRCLQDEKNWRLRVGWRRFSAWRWDQISSSGACCRQREAASNLLRPCTLINPLYPPSAPPATPCQFIYQFIPLSPSQPIPSIAPCPILCTAVEEMLLSTHTPPQRIPFTHLAFSHLSRHFVGQSLLSLPSSSPSLPPPPSSGPTTAYAALTGRVCSARHPC